jgi:hypothetical protein
VSETGAFTCPVCGWTGLDEAPYDAHGCPSYEICPCCGVEHGYDDASSAHDALRAEWIARGMSWWSSVRSSPVGWDPVAQLAALERRR